MIDGGFGAVESRGWGDGRVEAVGVVGSIGLYCARIGIRRDICSSGCFATVSVRGGAHMGNFPGLIILMMQRRKKN